MHQDRSRDNLADLRKCTVNTTAWRRLLIYSTVLEALSHEVDRRSFRAACQVALDLCQPQLADEDIDALELDDLADVDEYVFCTSCNRVRHSRTGPCDACGQPLLPVGSV